MYSSNNFIFRKYFDLDILDCINLNHKGNNELFKILLSNNKYYLLKKYSSIHMDNWKRGLTEFSALSYLYDKGFKNIPQPINFFKEDNIGIYSFEEGVTLNSKDIKKEHISNAVNFLTDLHSLDKADNLNFDLASSACLCIEDYLNVIDKRINYVRNFNENSDIHLKAKRFIKNDLLLKAEDIKRKVFSSINKELINTKMPLEKHVLTPADFGFHNILYNNGKYTFLDFEYFGRDDLARQILDFVHHDSSKDIQKNLRLNFVNGYIEKTENFDLNNRLKLLDPLIGLTWVLIYLNVFPKNLDPTILNERFEKAKWKLENLYFFD